MILHPDTDDHMDKKVETDLTTCTQCSDSYHHKWHVFGLALKGVTYRKIMRRTDVIKILFLCLCVCNVCPAHPCGENPMSFVDNFSRNRGVESAQMLRYMRLNTPSDYAALMSEYRRYLDCTQMVQNGYFKRSVDNVVKKRETLPSPFLEASLGMTKRSGPNRNRDVSIKFPTVERPDVNINNFLNLDLDSQWTDIPTETTEELTDAEQISNLPLLLKRLFENRNEANSMYREPESRAIAQDLFQTVRRKRR